MAARALLNLYDLPGAAEEMGRWVLNGSGNLPWIWRAWLAGAGDDFHPEPTSEEFAFANGQPIWTATRQ